VDERIPRGTVVFPGVVEVHFDGACQPPKGGGVATFGFVVAGEGLDHEECGLAVKPYSRHATNNVAEYVAAIRALEYLAGRQFRGTVIAIGDSQLVIRQMRGEYEVRAEHLRAYHERLGHLAGRFDHVEFRWVAREQNARADELSKVALERSGWLGRAPPPDAELAVDEEPEPATGASGSRPTGS